MSIKYTDLLTKYKRLFWQPSTKLGNPLFKRTETSLDKEILKIEEEDPEYSKLVKTRWSSPSNVRALFIGVNKAFAVYHRGLSEGNNKVSELTINDPKLSWILLNESGQEAVSERSLHLYTRDKLEVNKETGEIRPKDIETFENLEYTTNPIESVAGMFALSNVECICVTWDAFCPLTLHRKAEKDILVRLFSKLPRLEKIFYVPEGSDKLLGKGSWEDQIREYAQNRNKSVIEFIPELEQFEVFSKEVDFEKSLSVQRNQWAYDEFLSKINEEVKKKSEEKSDEFAGLNELKNFKANYEGNHDKIVMKRTDYTVQLALCQPDRVYYNKFEDCEYKSDPKKVVLIGTLGEEWLTKPSNVVKTYTKEDGSEVTLQDLTSLGANSLTLKPKSNNAKVWAYQVPVSEADKWYVNTSWGDKLKVNATKNSKGEDIYHGNGDWVVCYSDKDGNMDLTNVGVVNGVIFERTYTDWQEQKDFVKVFEENGWKVPDEFTESLYQQMLEEMRG